MLLRLGSIWTQSLWSHSRKSTALAEVGAQPCHYQYRPRLDTLGVFESERGHVGQTGQIHLFSAGMDTYVHP